MCDCSVARAKILTEYSPPVESDHLIGGSRRMLFPVMSAIPQSRQAILTALYRDTALLRPPGWGASTLCMQAPLEL